MYHYSLCCQLLAIMLVLFGAVLMSVGSCVVKSGIVGLICAALLKQAGATIKRLRP